MSQKQQLNPKEYFDLKHKLLFDGWGCSFRRSQLFTYRKYIDMLKSFNINGEALDIGCSTGIFTAKYLAPLLKNKILGCDISLIAIKKAKLLYPSINFQKSSLPKLEKIKPKLFSLITATEILYYLKPLEQKKSIEKIHQLLKLQGYSLISVNIGDKPYFSVSKIEKLIEHRFKIIKTDSIFIRTYYELIEKKIWNLLSFISDTNPFIVKSTDSQTKKILKIITNILFKNKFARHTYLKILAWKCKATLYIMPIKLINDLSKWINHEKERSSYIILAQKVVKN